MTENSANPSDRCSGVCNIKLQLGFLSTHRKFLFFRHQYQQLSIPSCRLFCYEIQRDAFFPCWLLSPYATAAVVCNLQSYPNHTAAIEQKSKELSFVSPYFNQTETYNWFFNFWKCIFKQSGLWIFHTSNCKDFYEN